MIGRGVRRIRQGVVGWQRAFSIQGQAFYYYYPSRYYLYSAFNNFNNATIKLQKVFLYLSHNHKDYNQQ